MQTTSCPRFVTIDQASLDRMAADGEPATFTGMMIPSTISDEPGFHNYYDVFRFTDKTTGRTVYTTPYPPLAWQRLTSMPSLAVPEPPRCPAPGSGNLQADLDACAAARQDLESRLDAATAANTTLQQSLGDLTAQVAGLERQLADARTTSSDCARRLKDLEARYDACLKRQQSLEAQLASAVTGSAGQQALVDQLAACDAELASLQAAYDELVAAGNVDAGSADLQAQLTACQAELASLRVTPDERDATIRALRIELAECLKLQGTADDPELVERLKDRVVWLTRQLTLCQQKVTILSRRGGRGWDPLAVYLASGFAAAGGLALWFGFGRKEKAA